MKTNSVRPTQFSFVVGLLVVLLGSGVGQAQTIFSAWPPCDIPGGLQGYLSSQWDDGSGVQGYALIGLGK